MVSEQQLQRFFAKECTAKEAAEVAAWLKSHPEEASAYFEEAEWQNPAHNETMPHDVYQMSWQRIARKIKNSNRYLLLQRCTAAACIAGCLFFGVVYLNKNRTTPAPAFAHVILPPKQPATTDTEYNVTNQPRAILLTDGSVVSLLPKSIIWFDTPFGQKAVRDIYLQGEARFSVAKNKLKPFTVYSGSFSTTALGTEFIVKQEPHNIRVQLMHGKVVIKNTDHSVKDWANVYLLPGQQMVFNDRDALARVSSIQQQTGVDDKLVKNKITQRETTDSLIFNGSAMATVFQKLHDYYRVNIQFADEDIKNITFTGVIVKKDSVQTILRAITQMNGLLVDGADTSFIISKDRN